ncbi:hydroxymethylglutaryl-CoA lyase [Amycolatopsis azurea]|uniref:Hydroxymethylglutaryl-CoA lyase n=1 Tax=Amycolatopsis azurea DSM 43854 TaxID=1238180 RepID=M2QL06_9PSEU|nr:hydroxymethylglutaryl-CoA lyase [Amycolatopsis azurea]EMD26542.1 Hydroxymethylglutaryl-CoA lyase [Amycolatopsis azurea DSM 43854]OOC05672.1 hydroxymethylglutaryl-CoA lyase [Amycolatopsis azurea DSM 43854]
MTDGVTICECFARDGLQHEPAFVPTATKVALLEGFVRAGFTRVEATSYSHPERVPAFADASDVLAALGRRPGVAFKATCPNPRAVTRALADLDRGAGAQELSLLVSASESHTERNLRTTRAAQWERIAEMIRLAGKRFRLIGVVSVAFGCPFEGAVDPGRVAEDVARFADLGADAVTLGDTTGVATPRTVASVFERLGRDHPGLPLIAHFHNSRGAGIANAVAALDAGCRHFDSAMGGVGGHPASIGYGAGLTGNVCTEDLVDLFHAMGVRTGLDLDALAESSAACEKALGRPLHSRVARAGFARTQGESRR